jgi:hypothetical protein
LKALAESIVQRRPSGASHYTAAKNLAIWQDDRRIKRILTGVDRTLKASKMGKRRYVEGNKSRSTQLKPALETVVMRAVNTLLVAASG